MRYNGKGQPTVGQYDDAMDRIEDLEQDIENLEARIPRRFVDEDGRTVLTADGETWVLKADSRGFAGLVEDVRALVEGDYPEDSFIGSPEPGSRLIVDLRAALRRFNGAVAANGQGETRESISELQWAVFKFRNRYDSKRSESSALAVLDEADKIGVWFFTCFTGIDAIQRAYTAEVERLKREADDLDAADALYIAVPLEGPDQVQVQMTGSWQADAEILKAGARRPAGQ